MMAAVDKQHLIRLARGLTIETSLSIDVILVKCKLTHKEYRRVYPETPVSPGLVLDVLDAKSIGMSNDEIKKEWSLSTSQFNYAMYNDSALTPRENLEELPRLSIIRELKKGRRTQTDIAEEYGVSQSMVHKIAKENGLLPANRKRRVVLTKAQIENIIKEVKEGTGVETLAKRYSVSRDTIYKQLRGLCE